jgi:hypothetical protein
MTNGALYAADTSTQVGHTGTSVSVAHTAESQRGSFFVTLTSHFTRMMFSNPPGRMAEFRAQILAFLKTARDPDRCIDELLRICTLEGGPHGLDAAIDVLSETGNQILSYAWDYLQRDVRNWTPKSPRAYQPNDDYWYVLLRAVGRAQGSEKERFRFITVCADASSVGIREGVVEGLRDLGTAAAKDRIKRFAEEDPSDFIKMLSQEALAEWGN